MRTARLATVISQQRDILLVLVFALVLLMMVLPLPAALMDFMIVMNISLAVVILLMALQTESPLHFSTFPSILLVTTLFRLSITISTTRLILLDGDAGRVIATFGKVVVGGNLIVGLVIFLIITIVQFLVVTKGADRVAEVGARFTLDGLPGKQMGVDADVRAGNIDQFAASDARKSLEREAKLFGAMDGAMKFVKGDAIAGLVITAVNLIGGIAIGTMQRNMSFAEAAHDYSLLTVGDGLVAQIPALMISVAAGTIVTRVANPKGGTLGFEIIEQMLSNTRTVVIAGVIVALFGLLPGFPTLVFATTGLGMIAAVLVAFRRKRKTLHRSFSSWDARIAMLKNEALAKSFSGVRTNIVKLVLPHAILSMNVHQFSTLFNRTSENIEREFGVPVGMWLFDIDPGSKSEYRIFIFDEEVASGEFRPDRVFVKAHPSLLKALDIPSVGNYGQREGALVPSDKVPLLEQHGIAHLNAVDMLLLDLKRTVAENAKVFADSQGTAQILDQLGLQHAKLVADLRQAVANTHVSEIFQRLLEERIPIVCRVKIAESLLRWSERGLSTSFLLQKVRNDLAEFLTRRYAPEGFLQVVVIAPTIESLLREGIRETNEGSFLVFEPSLSAHIGAQTRRLIGDEYQRGRHPVFLCQQDVRFPLHMLLTKQGIYVPVLAYSEIVPSTIVYPVGVIIADPEVENDPQFEMTG